MRIDSHFLRREAVLTFSFCLYRRHSLQPRTSCSAPPRGRGSARSAAHAGPQPAAISPRAARRPFCVRSAPHGGLSSLPHCCYHSSTSYELFYALVFSPHLQTLTRSSRHTVKFDSDTVFPAFYIGILYRWVLCCNSSE